MYIHNCGTTKGYRITKAIVIDYLRSIEPADLMYSINLDKYDEDTHIEKLKDMGMEGLINRRTFYVKK